MSFIPTGEAAGIPGIEVGEDGVITMDSSAFMSPPGGSQGDSMFRADADERGSGSPEAGSSETPAAVPGAEQDVGGDEMEGSMYEDAAEGNDLSKLDNDEDDAGAGAGAEEGDDDEDNDGAGAEEDDDGDGAEEYIDSEGVIHIDLTKRASPQKFMGGGGLSGLFGQMFGDGMMAESDEEDDDEYAKAFGTAGKGAAKADDPGADDIEAVEATAQGVKGDVSASYSGGGGDDDDDDEVIHIDLTSLGAPQFGVGGLGDLGDLFRMMQGEDDDDGEEEDDDFAKAYGRASKLASQADDLFQMIQGENDGDDEEEDGGMQVEDAVDADGDADGVQNMENEDREGLTPVTADEADAGASNGTQPGANYMEAGSEGDSMDEYVNDGTMYASDVNIEVQYDTSEEEGSMDGEDDSMSLDDHIDIYSPVKLLFNTSPQSSNAASPSAATTSSRLVEQTVDCVEGFPTSSTGPSWGEPSMGPSNPGLGGPSLSSKSSGSDIASPSGTATALAPASLPGPTSLPVPGSFPAYLQCTTSEEAALSPSSSEQKSGLKQASPASSPPAAFLSSMLPQQMFDNPLASDLSEEQAADVPNATAQGEGASSSSPNPHTVSPSSTSTPTSQWKTRSNPLATPEPAPIYLSPPGAASSSPASSPASSLGLSLNLHQINRYSDVESALSPNSPATDFLSRCAFEPPVPSRFGVASDVTPPRGTTSKDSDTQGSVFHKEEAVEEGGKGTGAASGAPPSKLNASLRGASRKSMMALVEASLREEAAEKKRLLIKAEDETRQESESWNAAAAGPAPVQGSRHRRGSTLDDGADLADALEAFRKAGPKGLDPIIGISSLGAVGSEGVALEVEHDDDGFPDLERLLGDIDLGMPSPSFLTSSTSPKAPSKSSSSFSSAPSPAAQSYPPVSSASGATSLGQLSSSAGNPFASAQRQAYNAEAGSSSSSSSYEFEEDDDEIEEEAGVNDDMVKKLKSEMEKLKEDLREHKTVNAGLRGELRKFSRIVNTLEHQVDGLKSRESSQAAAAVFASEAASFHDRLLPGQSPPCPTSPSSSDCSSPSCSSDRTLSPSPPPPSLLALAKACASKPPDSTQQQQQQYPEGGGEGNGKETQTPLPPPKPAPQGLEAAKRIAMYREMLSQAQISAFGLPSKQDEIQTVQDVLKKVTEMSEGSEKVVLLLLQRLLIEGVEACKDVEFLRKTTVRSSSIAGASDDGPSWPTADSLGLPAPSWGDKTMKKGVLGDAIAEASKEESEDGSTRGDAGDQQKDLQAALDAMAGECEELRSKVSQVERERDEALFEIGTAQHGSSLDKAKEAQSAGSSAAAMGWSMERTMLLQRLNDVEKEAASNTNTAAALGAVQAELQLRTVQLHTLEEDTESRSLDIQELMDRLAAASGELDARSSDSVDILDRLEDATHEVTRLTFMNEMLQDQRSTEKEELIGLRVQLSKTEVHIEEMAREGEELNDQVDFLIGELRTAQERAEVLQEEVDAIAVERADAIGHGREDANADARSEADARGTSEASCSPRGERPVDAHTEARLRAEGSRFQDAQPVDRSTGSQSQGGGDGDASAGGGAGGGDKHPTAGGGASIDAGHAEGAMVVGRGAAPWQEEIAQHLHAQSPGGKAVSRGVWGAAQASNETPDEAEVASLMDQAKASASNAIRGLQGKMDDLSEEVDELQHQLDRAEDWASELHSEAVTARNDHALAQHLLAELEHDMDRLKGEMAETMIEAAAKSQAAVAVAQSRAEVAEGVASELEQVMERLRGEMATLTDAVADSQAALAEAQSRVEVAEGRVTELELEMESLRGEMVTLTEAAAKFQVDMAEGCAAEVEQVMESLREEMATMAEADVKFQANMAEAQSRAAVAEGRALKLELEIDSLRGEIVTLTEAGVKVQAAMAEAQSRAEMSEGRALELEQESQALKAQADSSQESISQAASLQSELESAKSQAAVDSKKLEAAGAKGLELERQVELLTAEATTLATDMSALLDLIHASQEGIDSTASGTYSPAAQHAMNVIRQERQLQAALEAGMDADRQAHLNMIKVMKNEMETEHLKLDSLAAEASLALKDSLVELEKEQQARQDELDDLAAERQARQCLGAELASALQAREALAAELHESKAKLQQSSARSVPAPSPQGGRQSSGGDTGSGVDALSSAEAFQDALKGEQVALNHEKLLDMISENSHLLEVIAQLQESLEILSSSISEQEQKQDKDAAVHADLLTRLGAAELALDSALQVCEALKAPASSSGQVEGYPSASADNEQLATALQMSDEMQRQVAAAEAALTAGGHSLSEALHSLETMHSQVATAEAAARSAEQQAHERVARSEADAADAIAVAEERARLKVEASEAAAAQGRSRLAELEGMVSELIKGTPSLSSLMDPGSPWMGPDQATGTGRQVRVTSPSFLSFPSAPVPARNGTQDSNLKSNSSRDADDAELSPLVSVLEAQIDALEEQLLAQPSATQPQSSATQPQFSATSPPQGPRSAHDTPTTSSPPLGLFLPSVTPRDTSPGRYRKPATTTTTPVHLYSGHTPTATNTTTAVPLPFSEVTPTGSPTQAQSHPKSYSDDRARLDAIFQSIGKRVPRTRSANGSPALGAWASPDSFGGSPAESVMSTLVFVEQHVVMVEGQLEDAQDQLREKESMWAALMVELQHNQDMTERVQEELDQSREDAITILDELRHYRAAWEQAAFEAEQLRGRLEERRLVEGTFNLGRSLDQVAEAAELESLRAELELYKDDYESVRDELEMSRAEVDGLTMNMDQYKSEMSRALGHLDRLSPSYAHSDAGVDPQPGAYEADGMSPGELKYRRHCKALQVDLRSSRQEVMDLEEAGRQLAIQAESADFARRRLAQMLHLVERTESDVRKLVARAENSDGGGRGGEGAGEDGRQRDYLASSLEELVKLAERRVSRALITSVTAHEELYKARKRIRDIEPQLTNLVQRLQALDASRVYESVPSTSAMVSGTFDSNTRPLYSPQRDDPISSRLAGATKEVLAEVGRVRSLTNLYDEASRQGRAGSDYSPPSTGQVSPLISGGAHSSSPTPAFRVGYRYSPPSTGQVTPVKYGGAHSSSSTPAFRTGDRYSTPVWGSGAAAKSGSPLPSAMPSPPLVAPLQFQYSPSSNTSKTELGHNTTELWRDIASLGLENSELRWRLAAQSAENTRLSLTSASAGVSIRSLDSSRKQVASHAAVAGSTFAGVQFDAARFNIPAPETTTPGGSPAAPSPDAGNYNKPRPFIPASM